MPQRTAEERREYKRLYYLKHRERLKKKNKEWRANHPDYNKDYAKTEKGKKANRINTWKRYGVKHDNFDELYEHYISCENCEECGIRLIEGNLGANKRNLDHDHKTGLFRNVLCHLCNTRKKLT